MPGRSRYKNVFFKGVKHGTLTSYGVEMTSLFPNSGFFGFAILDLMIFELFFFVKKYLLVGASGMLWAGGSVSGSERDARMSHQSAWIYH